MSSSVPVAALIGCMLLLTVKHIIADFMLQNSWMAIGKDQKTGWALPLLAHCLVHLAVSLALILIVAPRFWFVAFIDFAIHITIDRIKGILLEPKTEWPNGVTGTVRDNGDLTLVAGDRIRHVDFGDGKVTAVTGTGPKSVAEVQFEKAGRKRLLIKISPIEKLS